ncbi:MAG: hypothetical protein L0K82_01860, partial [Pisciglobus halotolerans]|nr:hypothetical protein [Pisciglobus halotolerans]
FKKIQFRNTKKEAKQIEIICFASFLYCVMPYSPALFFKANQFLLFSAAGSLSILELTNKV